MLFSKRISIFLRTLLVMAALGYAALMSLHLARPVDTDPQTTMQLALLGMSPSDICGDAHNGAGGTCPACVLQHAVILTDVMSVPSPVLALSQILIHAPSPVAVQTRQPHGYQSRAPPLLLM